MTRLDDPLEHWFSEQVTASISAKPDKLRVVMACVEMANAVKGLRTTGHLGMVTVAMTGAGRGSARYVADYWVGVPSAGVPRIQEVHMMLGHTWTELVEAALFGA
jgi:D-sedoheptulose 7-phosphate isomerase